MNLLYIDLFCGAGGTSTGVENARLYGKQCAKVIACVNHDTNAIVSHTANHPEALHFTEDIRTLKLSPLQNHIGEMKVMYPGAYIVLWASLECTNFSNAKGGKPRDPDSRTLAEHLFRYIEAIKPDFIQIENVQEFMAWGDLDENGKPISRDRGRLFYKWVNNVCGYGYEFDYRILNSADFGAYTSRKRFFGIFAKNGLPVVFPEATHAKNPVADIFGHKLKKWKAVKEVLDLDDEGNSIFNRKKPLAEATLQRIYYGLIKFVAGGRDVFLIKWNSMHDGKCNPPNIDEPCPTIAAQPRLGVAKINFLIRNYGGDPQYKHFSIDRLAAKVLTTDHHIFISAYYGNGFNRSAEEPAPTVTTKDRLMAVSTFFINQYSGGGQVSGTDKPCPAIMTVPKQNLISIKKNKYYLMNPQFKSAGGSINDPCFTLIASMNKRPPYLINSETGNGIIEILPDDSPGTIKIKEFMGIYGISDIKIRVLKVRELKEIMGFPKDYVLVGNTGEQKKFIGNAVEVNMAKVLCEALVGKLAEIQELENVG